MNLRRLSKLAGACHAVAPAWRLVSPPRLPLQACRTCTESHLRRSKPLRDLGNRWKRRLDFMSNYQQGIHRFGRCGAERFRFCVGRTSAGELCKALKAAYSYLPSGQDRRLLEIAHTGRGGGGACVRVWVPCGRGPLGPLPQQTSLPLPPDAQFESTPRSDPAKSILILADYLEKIPRDYHDGQQFRVSCLRSFQRLQAASMDASSSGVMRVFSRVATFS